MSTDLPKVVRHFIGSSCDINKSPLPLDEVYSFVNFLTFHHSVFDKVDRNSLNVAVVGGGPSGLLSAIEAAQTGASVTVIEGRLNYTRKIWFDLHPESLGSISVSKLREWGFFSLKIPYIGPGYDEDHLKSGVITIQSHILEQFLSLVGIISGVYYKYGYKFSHYDVMKIKDKQDLHSQSFSWFAVARNNLVKDEIKILFDIIVAADGRHSSVRDVAGIATTEQKSFTALHSVNGESKAGRDSSVNAELVHGTAAISQVTILLFFKMNEDTRKCPEPRRRNDQVVSPFDIIFDVPLVTSAFKRFFEPFCELQILLTHDYGKGIFYVYSQSSDVDKFDALPWPILLKVAKSVLAIPPGNISELKAMLREDVPPRLFEVTIHRSSEAAVVLHKNYGDGDYLETERDTHNVEAERNISEDNIRQGKNCANTPCSHSVSALLITQGDALLSAHYRLGIGVNAVFNNLKLLNKLFTKYASDKSEALNSNINDCAMESRFCQHLIRHEGCINCAMNSIANSTEALYRGMIKEKVEDMVSKQLQAMFYEGYCGATVFSSSVYIPDIRQRSFRKLSELIDGGNGDDKYHIDYVETDVGITCPRITFL
eukprot:g2795.t1